MDNYETILEANKKYHDEHAKNYEEATMKGHNKRVEYYFEGYKGGRFLDMGCGTGEHMKMAAQFFDELYGIDCSTGMLDLAKQRLEGIKNVTLVEGDAAKTPWKDNYFDFINCYSVLHHVFDPYAILHEAYRVLKPGGHFYSDNDSNTAFYKWFKWWILFHRKFVRTKQKYLNGEYRELEKKAEYHQKNGLDAVRLKNFCLDLGFKEVRIICHYPDKPDTFTKILMKINERWRKENLYYYFSIIATK